MMYFHEVVNYLIKTFQNTENKEFIRELDLSYIREEVRHHRKKLRYFGLPSEGLYDIIHWNDCIDTFVAVEIGKKSEPAAKQNLLVARAISLGLHPRMKLLRGDINQIIIEDQDTVGTSVPYPFELINLDYGGSILYKDRIRVEALNCLIRNQRPIDFLLLVTSNVREFDQEELEETQERILQEIQDFRPEIIPEISLYFDSLNTSASLLRQILHLHFLLKYSGEVNGYIVTCFPAILYEGSKNTQLLHYILRFRHQKKASTRVISSQSLLQLLTQNHKVLNNNKLEDIQIPWKSKFQV